MSASPGGGRGGELRLAASPPRAAPGALLPQPVLSRGGAGSEPRGPPRPQRAPAFPKADPEHWRGLRGTQLLASPLFVAFRPPNTEP